MTARLPVTVKHGRYRGSPSDATRSQACGTEHDRRQGEAVLVYPLLSLESHRILRGSELLHEREPFPLSPVCIKDPVFPSPSKFLNFYRKFVPETKRPSGTSFALPGRAWDIFPGLFESGGGGGFASSIRGS